jgi:hypothetical protein
MVYLSCNDPTCATCGGYYLEDIYSTLVQRKYTCRVISLTGVRFFPVGTLTLLTPSYLGSFHISQFCLLYIVPILRNFKVLQDAPVSFESSLSYSMEFWLFKTLFYFTVELLVRETRHVSLQLVGRYRPLLVRDYNLLYSLWFHVWFVGLCL